MALRFYTGFDYYDETDVSRLWARSSGGMSITPGRWGGRAWGWDNTGGYLATPIPNATTVIVGMAFNCAYGDASIPFLIFQDSTTSPLTPATQVDIRITNDGNFQATRNGTVLTTTTGGIVTPFANWYYLEVKTTISDSSGAVSIRINGQTFLSTTGLDTKYTANNYVNMIRFQPSAVDGSIPLNFKIDDVYICDDTGTFNADFRGECRVQTQFPTNNGDRNDFQAIGAASNWQAVDEIIADDDATYVRSGHIGDIDDYEMGTVSLTGNIFGMQVNVTHRKDDVGSRVITPYINSSGTAAEGALFTCQSDYMVAQKIWESDPHTSAAWTNTALNATKVGLKIKG